MEFWLNCVPDNFNGDPYRKPRDYFERIRVQSESEDVLELVDRMRRAAVELWATPEEVKEINAAFDEADAREYRVEFVPVGTPEDAARAEERLRDVLSKMAEPGAQPEA